MSCISIKCQIACKDIPTTIIAECDCVSVTYCYPNGSVQVLELEVEIGKEIIVPNKLNGKGYSTIKIDNCGEITSLSVQVVKAVTPKSCCKTSIVKLVSKGAEYPLNVIFKGNPIGVANNQYQFADIWNSVSKDKINPIGAYEFDTSSNIRIVNGMPLSFLNIGGTPLTINDNVIACSQETEEYNPAHCYNATGFLIFNNKLITNG